MNEVTFTEIDKNIYVYRGLLPRAKQMVEIFKSSEKDPESSVLFKDWQKWSIFGTYVLGIGKPDINKPIVEPVPTEESLFKEISDAFYYATEEYLKNHGLSVGDDWVVMGPSISKYDHKNSEKNQGMHDLDMIYHTDYVTPERDWPGNKFILTCTMYLNDDYEGGGVSFFVPGKGLLDYKPVTGDVLVFPSGHPELLSEEGKYLHGVRKVKKSDKYLIRCFYQKPFDGNPEWLEKREQYGEDVWMQMEQERMTKERAEFQNKLNIDWLSKKETTNVD